MLDAEGWRRKGKGIRTKGARRLSLSLVYRAGRGEHRREAAAIRQMLRFVGIEASLKEVTQDPLLEGEASVGVLANGDFDLFLDTVETGEDPSVVEDWLSMPAVPPGGANYSRYRNLKVDHLLEEGARVLAWDQRQKIYLDVQRTVLADLPILPLFHPLGYTAMAWNLRGVDPHPLLGIFWNVKDWWVQNPTQR